MSTSTQATVDTKPVERTLGRTGARGARAGELIRYAASIADTVVVGCSTIAEVRENLAVARSFTPMSEADRGALERRIAPRADAHDTFKG